MRLFVLTPEEKRVIIFVALMILLGVAVKEYRKAHRPGIIVHPNDTTNETQKLAAALRGSPPSETPASSPRAKRTRKPKNSLAAPETASPAESPQNK